VINKIYSTLIDNIDLDSISTQCASINNEVNNNLFNKPQNYKINDNTPFGTRVSDFYNIFCYPSAELNFLFNSIKKFFYSSPIDNSQLYYIKGWVNFYNKGQSLGWHKHWGKENSYHGFFCVNSNISFTEYKFYDGEIIKVDSQDGLLVFSRSNTNFHRTSECSDDSPRITIGFDIHPYQDIKNKTNKWVPTDNWVSL